MRSALMPMCSGRDNGVVVVVIVVAVIDTGPWTPNAKPTSETNKQWERGTYQEGGIVAADGGLANERPALRISSIETWMASGMLARWVPRWQWVWVVGAG